MSSLRKKALIRLLICILVLIASIVFSALLLTGAFDGAAGTTEPTTSDTTTALPEDGTNADGTTDSTGDSASVPSDTESVESAEPTPEPTPEATPEPTPVSFEGLAEQPATVYAEGEQPSYTVTPDSSMNLRAGPGTDFDKVTQIPAGTTVTALGANADDTWVMVQYEGQYGWLAKEYLNAA